MTADPVHGAVDPLDLGWRGDPAAIIEADHLDPRDVIAALIKRPPWMADAECRRVEHQAVDFHPPRGVSLQPALQLCGRCPVLLACRSWSLDDPDPTAGNGVAGGLTPRARRAARLARKRGPS